MSNFRLNQFFVMVLFICPCLITESVRLLDNDISGITYQTNAHDKVSRRMQIYRKVPIEIRRRKRRCFLYNGTDNPNTEQKLMVDAFIKSSNSLFKDERDGSDDKATLEDSVGACKSKLGLYKSHMGNNDGLEMISAQNKLEHLGRLKRYLFMDKSATIRPLDHVRNGHGARRCDRDRQSNRMCLPKERILRSRQSNIIGGPYIDDLHTLPKFKRSQRSWHITCNPRYIKSKFSRFKRNNLGETKENTLEKMFALSDAGEDSQNPQSIVIKDKGKPGTKWFRKRQEGVAGECENPMKRSRCRKVKPTVIIQSVNIGRTGRIIFPLTHRCLKAALCPCSVGYHKCPPRTTCCTTEPAINCFQDVSTVGWRCQGLDTEIPTPLAEGMCPNPKSCSDKSVKRKRCACDCGCGCPDNLRRAHLDRDLSRGSCGCGCGCGCFHGEESRTKKPLT